MTENEIRYGCLSKSLEDFLRMTPKQRREKYGNGVHKYYERVVKSIEGSFKHENLALLKLTDKYRKKLDVELHYDSLLTKIHTKEWLADPHDKLIQRTYDYLSTMQKDMRHTIFDNLAKESIENVLDWLQIIKRLKRDNVNFLK